MTTLVEQQSLATVTAAELRRLLASGGVRRWLLVSFVLGVLGGVASVLLALVDSVQDILALTWSGVAGAGPLLTLLVMSIAVANFASGEIGDGTVLRTKVMVPRPALLFAARMAAWFTAVAGVSALSGVVALLIGALTPAPVAGSLVPALATLVLGPLVSGIGVTLVHAGSMVLRRGALVVAVALVVLVILPLVATAGQVLLSGTLSRVSEAVGSVMVGPLLLKASAVPEDGFGTWAETGQGLAGVLAWWLVVTAAAYRQFTREGFGDE